MNDREKLIELLNGFSTPVTLNGEKLMDWNIPMPGLRKAIADHLLANGVTFTPAIPGSTTEDPNIMELCFRNGENHMRDKIKTSLLNLSADMPCVTISQVIKILEDLQ